LPRRPSLVTPTRTAATESSSGHRQRLRHLGGLTEEEPVWASSQDLLDGSAPGTQVLVCGHPHALLVGLKAATATAPASGRTKPTMQITRDEQT